ncbi:hypothetical protein, partial [Paenibacillus polymyxa]|uniref:hypothetical protein n=1 Tax=Paenibacillus polymyxa TaxID=1406 RepID=UPI001C400D18
VLSFFLGSTFKTVLIDKHDHGAQRNHGAALCKKHDDERNGVVKRMRKRRNVAFMVFFALPNPFSRSFAPWVALSERQERRAP